MSVCVDKKKQELINRNLERLADIKVAVTVEAAQLRMPLKRVLSMAAGEILELGRKTSEPMTLRIGEVVIASCEVVITADGKPSIKITAVHNKHRLTELERTG